MAGIYGIFADAFDKAFPYHSLMFSSGFDDVTNKQFEVGDRGIIGRSSLDKFSDDRFTHRDGGDIFLNEGVLLDYDRKELPDAFIRDYRERGDDHFRHLAGTFCGLVASEDGRSITLYNDFLRSRPLYYFHDASAGIFVFSSELKFFAPVLEMLGVACEPNDLAWKELAVNGYLIGSHTLISSVEKLPRNSLLKWEYGKTPMVRSQGDDLDSAPVSEYDSKDALYDHIAERLKWNVKASRDKDLSYGYEHFQALSGGLDSRLNVALAHHLGYTTDHTLTFSQSGTREEVCAKAFAEYLGLKHHVSHLDGGRYFESDMISAGLANDGMVMIHAAAQQYHNVRKHRRPEFGMLHSGQIGGAVFGSFTRWRKPVYNMIRKQAFFRDDAVFDRFFSDDPRLQAYSNQPQKGYALFSFEERMVNGTMNGDVVCQQFLDTYSPFFDRNLIRILYNRPVNELKNQWIYFDFLKARFPFMLEVPIDRSYFKPKWFLRYVVGRNLQKVWKRFNRREDMNPYQVWFQENRELRDWLDTQYRTYEAMYGDVKWLQKLVRHDPSQILGYIQPLTLFLAYDTHFGERKMLSEQMRRGPDVSPGSSETIRERIG